MSGEGKPLTDEELEGAAGVNDGAYGCMCDAHTHHGTIERLVAEVRRLRAIIASKGED